MIASKLLSSVCGVFFVVRLEPRHIGVSMNWRKEGWAAPFRPWAMARVGVGQVLGDLGARLIERVAAKITIWGRFYGSNRTRSPVITGLYPAGWPLN
jgi:hypothetical protein